MEKILVVDDEKEICDLIGLILSNEVIPYINFIMAMML